MKPGRKLSHASIVVLNTLFKTGEMVLDDFLTNMGRDYDKRFYYRAQYKRLHNLKRAGYIKVKKNKQNQSFFHLTPKGKLRILKYLHLEKLKKRMWDGNFRVIIFDIPESLDKWRRYLRNELKNLGFEHLQESVYITPYPVTGELDQLLEEWNLRKYFRYLTVSEIDGAETLKRRFNIK